MISNELNDATPPEKVQHYDNMVSSILEVDYKSS